MQAMEAHGESSWLDRHQEVLSRTSRQWNGFRASVMDVAGGITEPVWLARHNVTMLAGAPLPTAATCDGVTDSRFQTPGEFDVFPAGSSVTWFDQGNSKFLAVGLEHELIYRTALEMNLEPDRVAIAPRLTCRDPQIEHLLWALKAELEEDSPLGALYADSVGVALASQLLRRWSRGRAKPAGAKLTKAQLTRVLSYIHERIAGELTLVEIAGVANVSPSHFNVLFKRSVGTPVHRYVMRKRVERAVELLTRTQLPLCDVALRAGFANQSHLALRMRRTLGLTPKALRAS
ncbi:MAG: AraC family transcriptional regulator [Candidatus Cybelea sp.]